MMDCVPVVIHESGDNMDKKESTHITSCTISWENTEDVLSVVTKVLQTEIQVRLYNAGSLIGGRIWPMSEQQKEELYSILHKCVEEWDCDDYSVDEFDSIHWQFKICTKKSCLRIVCGTIEPPPHGIEIKQALIEIIGKDNLYFF